MSNSAYKFKTKISWTPSGMSKTLENSLELFIDGTLPDSIKIIQAPPRDPYNIGDKIDLSGVIVHLLDENKNLWTSKDYPYGIAPFDELMPNPDVVSDDEPGGYDSGEKIVAPDGMFAYYFITSQYGSSYQWRDRSLAVYSGLSREPYYLTSDSACDGLLVKENGGSYYYYIWHGNPTVMYAGLAGDNGSVSDTVIPKKKWKQFGIAHMYGNADIEISSVVPTVDDDDIHGIGKVIKVEWKRPVDNNILSDKLPINVVKQDSTIENPNANNE